MTAAQPRQQAIVWDIVVSVVVWVLTVAVVCIAAFLAFFRLAFVDYCPPGSCDAGAAVAALFAAGAASVIVAVIGFAWGLVRMILRRTSWWITIGALVLCVACWAVGFVSASGSIGW